MKGYVKCAEDNVQFIAWESDVARVYPLLKLNTKFLITNAQAKPVAKEWNKKGTVEFQLCFSAATKFSELGPCYEAEGPVSDFKVTPLEEVFHEEGYVCEFFCNLYFLIINDNIFRCSRRLSSFNSNKFSIK